MTEVFYQQPGYFWVLFVRISSHKAPFFETGSYVMAKKASKRRSWTPAHVRTQKSLARKKKHAASIAKALNRTEGANRHKALTMGLSLDSRA